MSVECSIEFEKKDPFLSAFLLKIEIHLIALVYIGDTCKFCWAQCCHPDYRYLDERSRYECFSVNGISHTNILSCSFNYFIQHIQLTFLEWIIFLKSSKLSSSFLPKAWRNIFSSLSNLSWVKPVCDLHNIQLLLLVHYITALLV